MFREFVYSGSDPKLQPNSRQYLKFSFATLHNVTVHFFTVEGKYCVLPAQLTNTDIKNKLAQLLNSKLQKNLSNLLIYISHWDPCCCWFVHVYICISNFYQCQHVARWYFSLTVRTPGQLVVSNLCNNVARQVEISFPITQMYKSAKVSKINLLNFPFMSFSFFLYQNANHSKSSTLQALV